MHLTTVSAKMKTMRMWMEGMHEYVLTKRAPSLTIFIWSQSIGADSAPSSPVEVVSAKGDESSPNSRSPSPYGQGKEAQISQKT